MKRVRGILGSVAMVLAVLATASLTGCGGGGGAAPAAAAPETPENLPPVPAPAAPPTPPPSATLSWDAPTAMADGKTAASLSGYRIYYGTASGVYTAHVDVVDPTATSGAVTGLQAGTWYFAVAAVDTAGNESSLDYELSKTI